MTLSNSFFFSLLDIHTDVNIDMFLSLSHFSHSVVLVIISMNINSNYVSMTTTSMSCCQFASTPNILPPGQSISVLLPTQDLHFEVLFDKSLSCAPHSQSPQFIFFWWFYPSHDLESPSSFSFPPLQYNFGPGLLLCSWTIAGIANQFHHLRALLILVHPKWSSSWGLI